MPAHGSPIDRHPDKPLREYVCEVVDIELIPVESTEREFVMSAFTVIATTTYEGGEKFRTRNVVKLSNIRPTTDADLEYTMKIPDGTRAKVAEHRNLNYEWRNGELVKVIDREALRRFENLQQESQANWQRRKWWVVINVAVILVLLGWIIYRKRVSPDRQTA